MPMAGINALTGARKSGGLHRVRGGVRPKVYTFLTQSKAWRLGVLQDLVDVRGRGKCGLKTPDGNSTFIPNKRYRADPSRGREFQEIPSPPSPPSTTCLQASAAGGGGGRTKRRGLTLPPPEERHSPSRRTRRRHQTGARLTLDPPFGLVAASTTFPVKPPVDDRETDRSSSSCYFRETSRGLVNQQAVIRGADTTATGS